ncbi:hypothetical protein ACFFNY_29825 [Paenibacillus hodogayensis]|uniref:Uncharacterized protein n=1 Tax=Paenibacillus hodogayensis TaxID=279208 RepID=A0ABV5W5W3_9BACL
MAAPKPHKVRIPNGVMPKAALASPMTAAEASLTGVGADGFAAGIIGKYGFARSGHWARLPLVFKQQREQIRQAMRSTPGREVMTTQWITRLQRMYETLPAPSPTQRTVVEKVLVRERGPLPQEAVPSQGGAASGPVSAFGSASAAATGDTSAAAARETQDAAAAEARPKRKAQTGGSEADVGSPAAETLRKRGSRRSQKQEAAKLAKHAADADELHKQANNNSRQPAPEASGRFVGRVRSPGAPVGRLQAKASAALPSGRAFPWTNEAASTGRSQATSFGRLSYRAAPTSGSTKSQGAAPLTSTLGSMREAPVLTALHGIRLSAMPDAFIQRYGNRVVETAGLPFRRLNREGAVGFIYRIERKSDSKLPSGQASPHASRRTFADAKDGAYPANGQRSLRQSDGTLVRSSTATDRSAYTTTVRTGTAAMIAASAGRTMRPTVDTIGPGTAARPAMAARMLRNGYSLDSSIPSGVETQRGFPRSSSFIPRIAAEWRSMTRADKGALPILYGKASLDESSVRRQREPAFTGTSPERDRQRASVTLSAGEALRGAGLLASIALPTRLGGQPVVRGINLPVQRLFRKQPSSAGPVRPEAQSAISRRNGLEEAGRTVLVRSGAGSLGADAAIGVVPLVGSRGSGNGSFGWVSVKGLDTLVGDGTPSSRNSGSAVGSTFAAQVLRRFQSAQSTNAPAFGRMALAAASANRGSGPAKSPRADARPATAKSGLSGKVPVREMAKANRSERTPSVLGIGRGQSEEAVATFAVMSAFGTTSSLGRQLRRLFQTQSLSLRRKPESGRDKALLARRPGGSLNDRIGVQSGPLRISASTNRSGANWPGNTDLSFYRLAGQRPVIDGQEAPRALAPSRSSGDHDAVSGNASARSGSGTNETERQEAGRSGNPGPTAGISVFVAGMPSARRVEDRISSGYTRLSGGAEPGLAGRTSDISGTGQSFSASRLGNRPILDGLTRAGADRELRRQSELTGARTRHVRRFGDAQTSLRLSNARRTVSSADSAGAIQALPLRNRSGASRFGESEQTTRIGAWTPQPTSEVGKAGAGIIRLSGGLGKQAGAAELAARKDIRANAQQPASIGQTGRRIGLAPGSGYPELRERLSRNREASERLGASMARSLAEMGGDGVREFVRQLSSSRLAEADRGAKQIRRSRDGNRPVSAADLPPIPMRHGEASGTGAWRALALSHSSAELPVIGRQAIAAAYERGLARRMTGLVKDNDNRQRLMRQLEIRPDRREGYRETGLQADEGLRVRLRAASEPDGQNGRTSNRILRKPATSSITSINHTNSTAMLPNHAGLIRYGTNAAERPLVARRTAALNAAEAGARGISAIRSAAEAGSAGFAISGQAARAKAGNTTVFRQAAQRSTANMASLRHKAFAEVSRPAAFRQADRAAAVGASAFSHTSQAGIEVLRQHGARSGANRSAEYVQAARAGANRSSGLVQASRKEANRSVENVQASQAGANRAAALVQAVRTGANRSAGHVQTARAGANRSAEYVQAARVGANRSMGLGQAIRSGANRSAEYVQAARAGANRSAGFVQAARITSGSGVSAVFRNTIQADTTGIKTVRRARGQKAAASGAEGLNFPGGNGTGSGGRDPATVYHRIRESLSIWHGGAAVRPGQARFNATTRPSRADVSTGAESRMVRRSEPAALTERRTASAGIGRSGESSASTVIRRQASMIRGSTASATAAEAPAVSQTMRAPARPSLLPSDPMVALEHKAQPPQALPGAAAEFDPAALDYRRNIQRAAEPPVVQTESPPPAAVDIEELQEIVRKLPQLDVKKLADRVYREIEQRLRFDRQTRGL